MSKAECPVKCGKIFVSAEKAHTHANIEHPCWMEERDKRKGWRTPYGFADFDHPVTYEEACEQMKPMYEEFINKFKKGNL